MTTRSADGGPPSLHRAGPRF